MIALKNINFNSSQSYIKDDYLKSPDFKKTNLRSKWNGILLTEKKTHNPIWKNVVTGFANAPSLTTKNCAALIIIKLNKKYYGISFNHGDKFINKDFILTEFGKRASRILISSKNINKIQSLKLSSSPITREEIYSFNKFIPTGQEMDYDQLNLISDIEGPTKTNINNNKVTVHGKNFLTINSNVNSAEEVFTLIENIITLITANAAKPKIYFQPELKNIKNKNGKSVANKKLLKKVDVLIKDYKKSNNSILDKDLSNIALNYNVQEPENVIVIPGIHKPAFPPDYLNNKDIWSDLIKVLAKKTQIKNFDVLKYLKQLRVKELDSSAITVSSSSLLTCLIFETKESKNTELLFENKWYRLPSNYMKQIIEVVDSIPFSYDQSLFPSFAKVKKSKAKYSENDYNLAIKKKSFTLLDKRNFTLTVLKKEKIINNKSQIEICDLFKYDDKNKPIFYCIKKYSGSASISHLVTQAHNAIQIVYACESAREFVQKATNNGIRFNPRKSGLTLKLGIIAEWHSRKLSKCLPFLSIISIYNLIIDLKKYNVNVELIKINLK